MSSLPEFDLVLRGLFILAKDTYSSIFITKVSGQKEYQKKH